MALDPTLWASLDTLGRTQLLTPPTVTHPKTNGVARSLALVIGYEHLVGHY